MKGARSESALLSVCLLILLAALLVSGCSRKKDSNTAVKETGQGMEAGVSSPQTPQDSAGQSEKGLEAVFLMSAKATAFSLLPAAAM